MSNRSAASSFGATDTRCYIVNNRVPVFDYNTEQIKLDLSNNIVPILQQISQELENLDATFDLSINGSTLWADSTPVGNPFFADPNGREGWYYANFSNILNKSNIYWYSNPLTTSLQENDMTFAELSGMYCIITPDYVENGELTVPVMGVYSQPTGTADFIPGFAHSRWVYQLNATNRAKLRKGETIILYTGATRPQVHLNLPAYQLALFSQNGAAASTEIIAFMTVNTNVTTSQVGFLIQYAGYLNSAIGFNREYKFSNGKNRIIQNNQSSGAVSITGPVSLATGTLVGVTGSVAISSMPAVTISGAVSVTGSVGLTGSFIYGSYIGVTGNFQSGPISISAGQVVGITGGITGSVAVTTMPKIDISGVLPLGGKLPVYDASATDAINNHSIKAMIDDGTGTFSLDDLQGNINGAGLNSLSVYNYDLDVKINNDAVYTTAIETTVKNLVGLTGPYIYGSYLGVTGNFQSGPISIAPGQFVGITGGVTGSVSVSGAVSITGTVQTNDTSANLKLTTIETDISSGILVKGQDDVGARYPLYTDANGTQRTQILTGHEESAKYIFSTDLASIASPSANWAIDTRGRDGWYYSGASTALSWYSNSISSPPSLQFNKMQAVWMNLCCDSTAAIPSFVVETTLSIWYYTLTTLTSVINGETYCFYYGNKALNLNPRYHPLQMTRTLSFGPGGNDEPITSITVQSGAATNFLIVSAGIWNQTLLQEFSVIFDNNNDYQEQQKILSLDIDAVGSTLKTGIYGNEAGTSAGTVRRVNVVGQIANPGFSTARYGIATDSLTKGVNIITVDSLYPGQRAVTAEISSTNVNGITGQNRVALTTLVDNPVAYPVNATLTGTNYVSLTGTNYVNVSGGITGTVSLATGTVVGITGSIGSITIPAGAVIGITGGITGDVNILNFPVTQQISGSVSVTGGITGSVSVSNFPTLQGITGSVGILPNQTVGITGYLTTNNYSAVGLNTYNIYPKTIVYNMNGQNATAALNQILGGPNCNLTYILQGYGKANPRTWSATILTGGASKTLNYDYVNASGDLVSVTGVTVPVNSFVSLASNIISINKWSINATLGTADTLIIATQANVAYSLAGGNSFYNYAGVITVPNNYIGYFANYTFYSASATNVFIHKWDVNGVRTTVSSDSVQTNFTRMGSLRGSYGGIFTAGESVAISRYSSSAESNVFATFIIEAI